MAEYKSIPIEKIFVPERLRAVEEDHALAIQASIVEHGLINPITVRHGACAGRSFDQTFNDSYGSAKRAGRPRQLVDHGRDRRGVADPQICVHQPGGVGDRLFDAGRLHRLGDRPHRPTSFPTF